MDSFRRIDFCRYFHHLRRTRLICFGITVTFCLYPSCQKSAELPRPLVWRSALKAGVLLLSNFPAAFAIVVAAILIEARYTVTIQNQTSSSATDLRIHGGGCDIIISSISPHDSASRSFRIQHDDRLKLSLMLNGQERTHTIEGYVTTGQGGSKTVTIDQNEQLSTKCQEAGQGAPSKVGQRP